MTTNRVISDDNVWPKDIQLMVEQGYFTPMEETPLKISNRKNECRCGWF